MFRLFSIIIRNLPKISRRGLAIGFRLSKITEVERKCPKLERIVFQLRSTYRINRIDRKIIDFKNF